MSIVAGAYIATQQVHAVVGAVVPAGQTLVHVYAVSPVIRHQNVARGAFAVIAALGVHACVRAAGVHVILKILAFIDILAGLAIALQTKTERTGAVNARISVGDALLLMTMMRAVTIIALAAVDRNAGSIVILF